MKVVFLICIVFVSISIYAQSDSERIEGVWLNHLENVKVEIYQRDGKFFGKIIWINIPEDIDMTNPTDKNNPDPNLRSRKIVGLIMISDLEYSNGLWNDGILYSPNKGKTAKCKLEISDNNQILYITVSKGFLSKTIEWTRVNE